MSHGGGELFSSSDHETGHLGCKKELGEAEKQTHADTFDGNKHSHQCFELETA